MRGLFSLVFDLIELIEVLLKLCDLLLALEWQGSTSSTMSFEHLPFFIQILNGRFLHSRNEITRLAIVIKDFFFCKICKLQQPHMYRVLEHIESAHVKLWIYKCNFCDEQLYSESSLSFHQANDHKDIEIEKKENKS